MALSTTKRFSHKAAPYAAFYNEDGEPRLNVEGIVEVAGISDINVDNTSVTNSDCYVGKSADGTNADFSVAYASATTLTLGDYPTGITGFSATDIEFVRQINDVTGVVVATYSRDDAAMSIAGNVLTVGGAVFTADDYFVVLTNVPAIGAYDVVNGLIKVAEQYPSYEHTTGVEHLIDEDDCTGTNLTADAGGAATTLPDADGAFTVASTAVGYTAHNITEATSALVASVDTVAQITTGAGVTDWSSDEYYLPLVKRYEVDMDTYNFFTFQYILTTVANVTCYLKVYGTLIAGATVDDDASWEDMSEELLSDLDGYSATDFAIKCTGADTVKDISILHLPATMLKYMFKLVVEKSTTGVSVGCLYDLYIKKSS